MLTNLPKRELPVPAFSVELLPEVPLIVPTAGGFITDFLHRWYGSDFCSRMTIVATIDDIYFGLALNAVQDGIRLHAHLSQHRPRLADGLAAQAGAESS